MAPTALVHFSVCKHGQRPITCRTTNDIINFVNDYLNIPEEQRIKLNVLIIHSNLSPKGGYRNIPNCSYICDMIDFNDIFFKDGIEIENIRMDTIDLGVSDSVYEMLEGIDNN